MAADDPETPGPPPADPPATPAAETPAEPPAAAAPPDADAAAAALAAKVAAAKAAAAKAAAAKAAATAAGATAAPKAAPGAEAAAAKPAAAKPAAPAAGAAAAPKAPAAKAAHEPPKAAPPSGPPDPPPPADLAVPAFITTLGAAVPGAVAQLSYYLGDWTVIVPVEQLLAAARHLRDAPDALFDYCSDLTATDWPPRAERFDVLYILYSTRHRHRVRLKVKVADHQVLPSVTGIWLAADWFEREVYDMFGLNITGHPDRRRILMPEDWQGFPQRKDYPLEGPGELLMENPLDWLKLKQARDEADIE